MTAKQGSSFGSFNGGRLKGELWSLGLSPLDLHWGEGIKIDEGSPGSWGGPEETGGPHMEMQIRPCLCCTSHHEDNQAVFLVFP